MKSMVVAYDRHRAIGKNGSRPWEGGKMKADMRHFRELTREKTVIMGRRTFEIDVGGRALPKRLNIVLSRDDIQVPEGVLVAHSLQEAYAMATSDEVIVIGGGQIYLEALPDIDVVYATEIDADIKGDAFFPVLASREWEEVERENHSADSENIYDYAFVTYKRIR